MVYLQLRKAKTTQSEANLNTYMSRTKIKKSRNAHENQNFNIWKRGEEPPPLSKIKNIKISMQNWFHIPIVTILNQILAPFKKVLKLISKANSEHETFRRLTKEMQLNYEQTNPWAWAVKLPLTSKATRNEIKIWTWNIMTTHSGDALELRPN